jgi:hypothetical protein
MVQPLASIRAGSRFIPLAGMSSSFSPAVRSHNRRCSMDAVNSRPSGAKEWVLYL